MTIEDDITGNWSFDELPSNVRIGRDCFIERKASFSRYRSTEAIGLTLADNVRIYTWTEFSVEPTGAIDIGRDSTIVGAIFMCAERISIGERVLISYHVTIADSDFHPIDPEERRLDALANAPDGDRSKRPSISTRPVTIEDDVEIGIGAIILKGVRIHRGARVLAGAVVTQDVPPYAVIAGNPGRLMEQSAS